MLALLVLWPTWVQAAGINAARVWPAPDNVRLVFDLDGPVTHRMFALDNPRRLVIDLDDVRLNTDLSRLDLAGTPMTRVRSAVRDGNGLRIVLDMSASVQHRSFLLRPNEQYGHRLVVDLVSGQAATAPQARPEPREDRRIVIAIDPGHGGEDPGAIGPAGTREKQIVFAIARELQRLLDADPLYETLLTRTGDYYVGLRQRVQVARDARADLFLSIHADAYRTPQPRGSSVYILSERGASSESARWLADSENRADLIGGEEGVLSLSDKDALLAEVLVDLSMNGTLLESRRAADHVLRSIAEINRLHRNEVEQAGFVVLKSPDMPSMLIEAGFISNPQEEARLRDPAYQRRVARQIADAVRSYFRENPPPHTLLAAGITPAETSYTVRRGDSLSVIAQRHGVTLRQLRQANNLRNDTIRVGQVLRIPPR